MYNTKNIGGIQNHFLDIFLPKRFLSHIISVYVSYSTDNYIISQKCVNNYLPTMKLTMKSLLSLEYTNDNHVRILQRIESYLKTNKQTLNFRSIENFFNELKRNKRSKGYISKIKYTLMPSIERILIDQPDKLLIWKAFFKTIKVGNIIAKTV